MSFKFYRSTQLFYLLFSVSFTTILCDCDEGTPYSILVNGYNLALDTSIPSNVTIETYDGSEGQQFLIQCAERPGLFYITSVATGDRLDILRDSPVHDVVTSRPDGSLYQEWFLDPDGYINNVALFMNLQAKFADFEPGTPVSVWYFDPPTSYQQWTLKRTIS